jgi:hypothetical protein
LIYLICQLDLEEAYLDDPLWADAPEKLPDGSFILVREIKKAMDGEGFKYIPSGKRKQEDVPGISEDDFNYYFSIHRYCHKFGLPHGNGWINELPWLPEFLAYMDDMRLLIDAWRNGSAMTKSSGPADLGAFTGG